MTEMFSVKHLFKLNGISNIEDALKKLNQLTQEEARMATAQALKVTHTFDDRVRRVTDKVLGVSDTVAGVNDREASDDGRLRRVMNIVLGVDDRVAGVDDRVVGVDDRTGGIDDIVAGVDDRVIRPSTVRPRSLLAVHLRSIIKKIF